MTFEELLTIASSQEAPGLCIDSRLVRPGDIFVAIPGTTCDGHDFITEALANSAAHVVCRRIPSGAADAPERFVRVQNPAVAAALLAQARADEPAAKLTNLAITGTNGKTTVAFLAQSCIQQAGQKCGLIGTILYDTGSASRPAFLTTPDCLSIAQSQKEMVDAGAAYMVIEASSHALCQDRLAAIPFQAAAFTNLSGDHLDFHKTKRAYLDAKTKLFCGLSPDAIAVLNKQSPEAAYIAEKTKAKVLWYAIDAQADIAAHVESTDITGTSFVLEHAGASLPVKTSLPGMYNVANCLAAAGLALAAGVDLETIAAALTQPQTIPGRLEKIDADDFSVIIDYAHTDDALSNVLSTLKPLCKGRLIIVFGCGGDRDKTKRPRMAATAEQFADLMIVTSDNPRTEDPDRIIQDILPGFADPKAASIFVQPDRAEAIALAISSARAGDIVLIAGKGHETYQIIGQERFDFSDKDVARGCLKRRIEAADHAPISDQHRSSRVDTTCL